MVEEEKIQVFGRGQMGIKYLSVNLGRSSLDAVARAFPSVNIVPWDSWYCDDIIAWAGASEALRLANLLHSTEQPTEVEVAGMMGHVACWLIRSAGRLQRNGRNGATWASTPPRIQTS